MMVLMLFKISMEIKYKTMKISLGYGLLIFKIKQNYSEIMP